MKTHHLGIVVGGVFATAVACSSYSIDADPAPAAVGDAGTVDAASINDAKPEPDPLSSLDSGMTHALPPKAGAAHFADGTTDLTYAISRFYLGDTDRDEAANKDAWKQYGYDLDGKLSTEGSTDLCKPRAGASTEGVYGDGIDGRDNSFGKLVLPLVRSLDSAVVAQINGGLVTGDARPLLSLQELGAAVDYMPLGGLQFRSLALGAAPKYDGTDNFRIDATSLSHPPDLKRGPNVAYPQGYMTANTWVSGQLLGALNINIPGLFADAAIRIGVITMDLSADRKHATNGVIAGVISVTDMRAAIQKAIGAYDPSLCKSVTANTILAEIDHAADIMADGSQDPTKTCDGISIGVGFDAEPVRLGAVGPPPAPPPNLCE